MIYIFEDFALDPDRRELKRGAELIPVEPLVFDLLQNLIQNCDRVVSKDDLIASVWNGRIVSESTLTSRMNAARHAVGDNGEQQRLIRTIARKGFRFVGEVQEEQKPVRSSTLQRLPQEDGEQPTRPALPDKQAVTFCRTKDGVTIGVATVGAGPALVRTAYTVTHLEYDWNYPYHGPLLQRLAKHWRVVRYDARGTGLSDRNASNISPTTYLDDLETVVDSLKFERFALLGMSGGAATAIAFAARHPDRVSKLVLFGGYAFGRQRRGAPQTAEEAEAFYTMLRSGWGDVNSQFWRAFSSFFVPNATPEQLKWFMEYQLVSTSAENAIKIRIAVDNIDVIDLLPKVHTPTIVFHCLRDNLVPFEQGRLLAASIPNAKFVALESENHMLLPQEPAWVKFVNDMEAFLSDET